MFKLVIDTGAFITEIEKRPSIWNKCNTPADTLRKQQQWKEIVEMHCGLDVTTDQKRQLDERLRHKWRNIRDCFVKAHKAKTIDNNQPNKKKKKHYAYYDNLLFLLDQNKSSNYLDMHDYNKDNQSENDSDQEITWTVTPDAVKYEITISENESFDQSDTDLPLPARSRKKRTENPNDNEDARMKRPIPWDFDGHSFIENAPKPDIPYTNYLEEDDDRLFFLSLVKEFKKVPENHQLETKLNILKVIQKAQENVIEND